MRAFVIIFGLLFAPIVFAQNTVTFFEHMNTSTPGTAMTTTIANAGLDSGSCTNGGNPGCGWNGLNGSGVEVGAAVSGCSTLSSTAVRGGSTYPVGTSDNSIEIIGADNFSYLSLAINGPTNQSKNNSMLVCMQTPPAFSTGVVDPLRFDDQTGFVSSIQIQPTNSGTCGTGTQAINIETPFTSGMGTTCYFDTPGAVYWISFFCEENTGTTGYTVYSSNGSVLYTSPVITTLTGNPINAFHIGNLEVGTPSANYYYQNLMYDLNGAYPMAPVQMASSGSSLSGGSWNGGSIH